MQDDVIYAKLLGGNIVVGEKTNSPLPPNDANPSFWLFRGDDGSILWHDARISGKYDRRAIGLAVRLWGVTYAEAYKRLKMEPTPFISFKEVEKPKRGVVVGEIQEWEMPFWEKHSTYKRTLSKLEVYGLRGFYIDGCFKYESEPNNARYVYVCGRESFQMYKPFEERTFRFRGHNLKNVLFGYNTLETGDDLVITSSMKDVIMFYNIGIKAIAPTSEGVFSGIREKYGELRNRFNNIYVCFDNDKKGREATKALCNEMWGIKPMFLSGPEKDGADIVKNYGLGIFRDEIKKLL